MPDDDFEVRRSDLSGHHLFPWLVTLALSALCFGVIWIVCLLLP
jgi:hypothetical protein